MNKEKFNSFVAIWCYLIIFSIIFIFWNSVVDERIDKLEQKISSSYVDRDTLENILNNLIYKNGTCNIDTYKQEECQENTAFRCLFWGDWVWAEIPDGRAQEKCRTINKTQYPTTTIPLPPTTTTIRATTTTTIQGQTTTTTIPDELCCTSNYEGIYMIGSPIRFWVIEDIQNNIMEFLCVDCGDIPKLKGFSTDKILNMSPKSHPLIEFAMENGGFRG